MSDSDDRRVKVRKKTNVKKSYKTNRNNGDSHVRFNKNGVSKCKKSEEIERKEKKENYITI